MSFKTIIVTLFLLSFCFVLFSVYEISHRDRGQDDNFSIIAKTNCVVWLLLGAVVLIYGVLEKCQKDPAYIKKFILTLLGGAVLAGGGFYWVTQEREPSKYKKMIEEPLVRGEDGSWQIKEGGDWDEWQRDRERKEKELTWGQIAIIIIIIILCIICPPFRNLVMLIFTTIGLIVGVNWVLDKLNKG